MINLNRTLNVLLILLICGYILYYFYKKPAQKVGEYAQNFQGVLMNEEKFNLSDLKGNYVLLDFWGSWCGPCRIENSKLVVLNEEMKDKVFSNAGGFHIVSVAIESKKENWEKAVEKDKLSWKYQLVEFDKFSSPVATLYGIKEIPATFLISPEGLILMVNPKISEIKSYLYEQLDN